MKRKPDYVSPFAPPPLQEFHHYYGLIRHSPEGLVFALPRRAYGFPSTAFGEFPLFRKRAWFKVMPPDSYRDYTGCPPNLRPVSIYAFDLSFRVADPSSFEQQHGSFRCLCDGSLSSRSSP